MDATDKLAPVKPKHRLLFELGRGGMGTVFLAVTEGPSGFRKLKVIKRLRADLAADSSLLRMFLDEARLSARLAHPNVVQTNEVGFDGTHYYLEMEYLDGQSLHALFRAGATRPKDLPLPVVLWILCQTLAGLHYAHELTDVSGAPLNVVHRDVSPHNIFVTYDGNVKVLDFGIARAADSSHETRTGVVRGKLAYMAPEQAAGRPLDRRADIFAVGVILWESLTGRRLWGDLTDGAIFEKLEKGLVPAPRETAAGVPEELDLLCKRALARDARDRFATAADMQRALEDHLDARRHRVGSRQVAEAIGLLCGARREEQRREIEARLTERPAPVGQGVIREPGSDPDEAHRPAGPEAAETRTTDLGPTTLSRPSPRAATRSDFPRPAPPPPRLLSPFARGSLLILTAAAIAVFFVRAKTSPRASVEPVAAGTKPAACTRNSECADAGTQALCRKGACVPLASEDCTVLAERGDVQNDATLWFGAMLPLSGEHGKLFGQANANALDLARRDFVTMHRGLPSPRIGEPARPLAVLMCDDSNDPPRAARHLVDEVGVPAVVGFHLSREVTELAGSLFVPRGVLAVAALNVSPLVTRVPHPPGSPRLVWRTTASSDEWALPLARLVSDVDERELRATGILAPAESMRVAVVRTTSSTTLGVTDALSASLRFNGKTALANGDDFRQFNCDPQTVDELVRYRPHVIIHFEPESYALIPALEARWPAGARFRPRYASYDTGGLRAIYDFIGTSAERRHRFLVLDFPTNTVTTVEFANRYNLAFQPPVTPATAPGCAYDALYVLAYAAYATEAIDHLPVTGPNLARGIAHLVPPGLPVDVRPTRIDDALDALRAGRNIDLNGTMTTLDFDLETGNSRVDFAVYCIKTDADGKAVDAVESGLVYRSAGGQFEGKMKCP
jgi:hypothetical protein